MLSLKRIKVKGLKVKISSASVFFLPLSFVSAIPININTIAVNGKWYFH